MNVEPQVIDRENNKMYQTIENVKLWFRSLLNKWWLIGIVGLAGGIIGFWTVYIERPKYQSRLTFALEDGGGGMGGALSLAAEFGLTIGNSKNIFEGDNILTLLTSRTIVQRVLLSVDTLSGKPITMADYFSKISADSIKKDEPGRLSPQALRLSKVSFPVGQPRSSFSYLQDSVLRNMYEKFSLNGGLKVSKPDKKLNLYEVSVVSYDERFSKVFTDKLIKEATDFYVDLKTRKSKETLEILEARVAQVKGSLNGAISSRASIQDANVNPAFQQAQAQLQQRQVDISAYSGTYGELYKNLELARYQYLQDIPLLQIIDAADYPMTRIKRGKLKTAIIFAFVGAFIIIILLTLTHIVKSELYYNRNKISPVAG
jgi:uncharacterized protein involved in exopolysaccharide biosynthesis